MKIKICGLTREEDIDAVNDARADFAGFVFAPNSKRHVTFNRAEELRKRLNIAPVGVFVNAKISDIRALYFNGVIDYAQLHGFENEEYVAKLDGVPRIKYIAPHEDSAAEYYLFDGKNPGSGKSFDWETLPKDVKKPWFLAGGINLYNIRAAIALNPYCIDISSGAETDGVKDGGKISRLVNLIRGKEL